MIRRYLPVLAEIGCIGPVMLLLALTAMVMESASGKTVSTIPMLLWAGIILLVVGQIGLATGLFKLRRKLDNENALKTMEESDGFAEIYPEDKHLIVKSLQAGGHVVGMTEDGVNDAPALKQA